MKTTRYFVLNTLLLTCLYYGFLEGVNGALNVALTFAWFLNIIGTMLAAMPQQNIDDIVKELGDRLSPTVPVWFDNALDVVVVFAFAWHEYFWTAGFFIVHMLGTQRIRNARDKLIESQQGNAETRA